MITRQLIADTVCVLFGAIQVKCTVYLSMIFTGERGPKKQKDNENKMQI